MVWMIIFITTILFVFVHAWFWLFVQFEPNYIYCFLYIRDYALQLPISKMTCTYTIYSVIYKA